MSRRIRSPLHGGLGVLVAIATGACGADMSEPVAEPSAELQQAILVSNHLQFGSVNRGASSRSNYHSTSMVDWGTTAGGDVVQPVVVVGDPSYNASDPTTVRVRNVTSTGFETALREWSYLDGSHANEKMGYFAFWPGTIGFRNGYPEPPLGRAYKISAQRVEGVTDEPQHVSFATQFTTKPLVFATQVSHNGGDPTIVRVWDVTTEGFNVQLQEERGNDGSHTAETINYVAIEQDFIFRFPATSETNGLCGHVHAFEADANTNWTPGMQLASGHILVGLQTKNGSDPANARWRSVTVCSNGFCKDVVEVRVDEEASDGESSHTVETIGGLRMWLDDCDRY